MTRPAILPIVGKMSFTETTKEKLLGYWQGVERQTGLSINYKERVTSISRRPDGASFEVKTTKGSYVSRAVLLTIGRRGSPRQLGVPGEKSAKVVYRLIDPEQYRGRHVLVVGGGDSALEAAHSIADQAGTTVTLSYRSPAFSRAKPKNRDKVAQLAEAGRLNVMMNSNVREIRRDSVVIDVEGETVILPNQAVIVCAGGILPTGFLREVGIEVETKYGTA
jgi:thioredoxin reductase (NADPH)